MSMSPEQKNLCIEITAKLQAYPGAEMFNEPVDPIKQNAPNYFRKIRNPKDLGSIMNMIKSSGYDSVTQWEQDINTVWSNAVTYNGEDSYVANLAKHMEKHFNKLKKPLSYFNVHSWTQHIYSLRQKFERLTSQAPASLGPITSNLAKQSSILVDPMTAKEISQMIKASQMINEPRDVEAIAEIIKNNEPNVSNINQEVAIFDVNNLQPTTLHEMSNYYKKQCIERNLTYPQ